MVPSPAVVVLTVLVTSAGVFGTRPVADGLINILFGGGIGITEDSAIKRDHVRGKIARTVTFDDGVIGVKCGGCVGKGCS